MSILTLMSYFFPLALIGYGLANNITSNKPIHYLAVWVIIMLFERFFGTYVLYDPYPFEHLIGLFYLAILYLFFQSSLSLKLNTILSGYFLVLVTFYVFNSAFLQSIHEPNLIGQLIIYACIFPSAVFYFVQLYRKHELVFLDQSPLFWIYTALLLYAVISSWATVLQLMAEHYPLGNTFSYFKLGAEWTKNLLIGIGFIQVIRHNKFVNKHKY